VSSEYAYQPIWTLFSNGFLLVTTSQIVILTHWRQLDEGHVVDHVKKGQFPQALENSKVWDLAQEMSGCADEENGE
jgi:hypothetical protein